MPFKIGTIMLYVSDVARSKEFYTRVLNAKVLPDFAKSIHAASASSAGSYFPC
jgi:catechol 2,3-dioxygenase-like lactoylglutathione lyase family enzyme